MRTRQTARANMQFLDRDARRTPSNQTLATKKTQYPEDWDSVPFEEKLRLYIEYSSTGNGESRQSFAANTQFLETDSVHPTKDQTESENHQIAEVSNDESQHNSSSAASNQGQIDCSPPSSSQRRRISEDKDRNRSTSWTPTCHFDSSTRLSNVQFFRRDINSTKSTASVGSEINAYSEPQYGGEHPIINPKSMKTQSPVPVSSDDRSTRNLRPQMVMSNTHFLNKISRPSILAPTKHDAAGQSEVNNLTGKMRLKYKPLKNNTKGSVRLVRLEPSLGTTSASSEALKCTLVNAEPWMQDLQYECLSYCWGEIKETVRIFVKASDDSAAQFEPFLIPINLYNALRRLQDTHASCWIWVDLICINQVDSNERSSQVRFMKEIYGHSSSVIIWLGESDASDSLDSAVSIIWTLWKLFSSRLGHDSHHVIEPSGLSLDEAHLEILRTLDLGKIMGISTKTLYEHLTTFFSLPWFRRVWVLQEAFSHTSITVRLGKHSIQWRAVIIAALWQSYRTRSYVSRFSDDNSGGYLPELWLSLLHSRTPNGLPILELVCRARDFQATDPRDKVFALLGLSNDLDENAKRSPLLKPDYGKSKVQVYCDFARALIEQHKTLDVLTTIDTFTPQSQERTGPSWMPDLDVTIATIRGLGFPRKYNASYSTPVNTSILHTSQREGVISLSGYIIDDPIQPYSPALMFHSNLQLYIIAPAAAQRLWLDVLRPRARRNPEKEDYMLWAFILSLTATGFASPTEPHLHPLGNIVPCHEVPSIMADFAAYWALSDPRFHLFTESLASKLKALVPHGDADQFAVLVGKACHERKFFVTGAGRIGLCPRATCETDKIVILYGGGVPYVLRQIARDEWSFVGECYLDGMMFGEAKEMKEREGIKDQIFHIF